MILIEIRRRMSESSQQIIVSNRKKRKNPITSFGIILFYRQNYKSIPNSRIIKEIINELDQKTVKKNDCEEYSILLIQRVFSMAFIDIIKGNYPLNDEIEKDRLLKIYFSEITIEELEYIKKYDFDTIWGHVWKNINSKYYRNEKKIAKEKYEMLNLKYYTDNLNRANYKYTEFGFPKGKKQSHETILKCAIREFKEETDIDLEKYKFHFFDEKKPLIKEEFIGTNGQRYRHLYYLAELINTKNVSLEVNNFNFHQIEEVKSLGFFSISQCYNIFRDYDIAKKNILPIVDSYIKTIIRENK